MNTGIRPVVEVLEALSWFAAGCSRCVYSWKLRVAGQPHVTNPLRVLGLRVDQQITVRLTTVRGLSLPHLAN
jgi:hypothetical protein